MGWEGQLRGTKSGYAIKICLVPWEWRQRVRPGHSCWSATELVMRLGGLDLEKREAEDLRIAYLLGWLVCFLDWWASRFPGKPDCSSWKLR